MSHSLEFELPFSKAKVVLKQPSWGERKAAMRKGEKGGLDSEEIELMMLLPSMTVNGAKIQSDLGIAVFDSWDMADTMHLIKNFDEWCANGPVLDTEKNSSPTQK